MAMHATPKYFMAPAGMVLLMASPDFRAEYFPQIQVVDLVEPP
jgi:hypothetical protein